MVAYGLNVTNINSTSATFPLSGSIYIVIVNLLPLIRCFSTGENALFTMEKHLGFVHESSANGLCLFCPVLILQHILFL